MSEPITNRDTGRWLRLMADLEHDAEAAFPSAPPVETSGAAFMEADITAAIPQPNVGDEAPLPMRGASSGLRYEDFEREQRVYELGGFGGPFDPPSGNIQP